MKKLKRKWSFSNFVSLLRKHVFSYVSFEDFFNRTDEYIRQWIKDIKKPPDNVIEIQFGYT